MLQGFAKYKLVYRLLWQTYGSSGLIRLSFAIQLMTRMFKLVALPIASSVIIAELSRGDFSGAYRGVAFFVGFSLLIGLLAPLTKYIGMLGENKIYKRDTATYFGRLVNTDLDYFNDSMSGYLTSATRHYVDSAVQLVRSLRERYMYTICSIVFPLVVLCWVDPVLGLVALGLSSAQAVYLLWASQAIDPLRTSSRELYKANSGRMADIISNILAVKATAQETAYTARVEAAAGEEAKRFKIRYTKQAKLIAIREGITVSFFMVLLWLTVQRMQGGAIDIGAAVLVVTYTATILTGIYTLSDDLDQHDDLVDKIIPAFEILDRPNTITDPPQPQTITTVQGDIRFQSVNFAYADTAQTVFEGFTLHIPAGQKVGIVGVSGAGKSTLAKLLLRFNDVTAGTITLDGTDIRQLRQADLRRAIAYVPQEPLLFHASIKDNVLLGNPQATDKQVTQALTRAHAMQFISRLPEGLDSIVGERGVKLSGGQKQRIAIARAILRQTPLIILDEATSALDSDSEQIIKASFAEILSKKTAIVIAHRLSTLSEMDRIIVIDKGRCIEDGNHETLLAKNGAYARLWKRQLKHVDE